MGDDSKIDACGPGFSQPHLDDLRKRLGQRQRWAGDLGVEQRVVVQVTAGECTGCRGQADSAGSATGICLCCAFLL